MNIYVQANKAKHRTVHLPMYSSNIWENLFRDPEQPVGKPEIKSENTGVQDADIVHDVYDSFKIWHFIELFIVQW